MGIAGTVVTNSSSLDALSRGAGVFVAVFGSLAVVVEATIIILRFLNIGLINIHMKQFLILVYSSPINNRTLISLSKTSPVTSQARYIAVGGL